jgi:hypothetical protein
MIEWMIVTGLLLTLTLSWCDEGPFPALFTAQWLHAQMRTWRKKTSTQAKHLTWLQQFTKNHINVRTALANAANDVLLTWDWTNWSEVLKVCLIWSPGHLGEARAVERFSRGEQRQGHRVGAADATSVSCLLLSSSSTGGGSKGAIRQVVLHATTIQTARDAHTHINQPTTDRVEPHRKRTSNCLTLDTSH